MAIVAALMGIAWSPMDAFLDALLPHQRQPSLLQQLRHRPLLLTVPQLLSRVRPVSQSSLEPQLQRPPALRQAQLPRMEPAVPTTTTLSAETGSREAAARCTDIAETAPLTAVMDVKADLA